MQGYGHGHPPQGYVTSRSIARARSRAVQDVAKGDARVGSVRCARSRGFDDSTSGWTIMTRSVGVSTGVRHRKGVVVCVRMSGD